MSFGSILSILVLKICFPTFNCIMTDFTLRTFSKNENGKGNSLAEYDWY